MLHFRGNTCKPNQTSKCSSRWCSPQKGLQAPEGTIEFGASTTNLQISRHLHLHEANCPQPDIVSRKLSHLFVFSAFLRALKSWWFPGNVWQLSHLHALFCVKSSLGGLRGSICSWAIYSALFGCFVKKNWRDAGCFFLTLEIEKRSVCAFSVPSHWPGNGLCAIYFQLGGL